MTRSSSRTAPIGHAGALSLTAAEPRADLRTPRRGMTLVETMIAMVILGAVLSSLGVYAARFTTATSQANNRAIATELAADRLERIKGATTYPGIDSMAVTETNPLGLKGFVRQTVVRRVGGSLASDTVDFKVITVSVTAPGIKAKVAKTTTIAQF